MAHKENVHSNHSMLYGVDYSGRVLCFNSVSESSDWATLNCHNKVDVKRLTSISGILWAISSDHQIYVFVPKKDVPIRVREEIYENERWNPVNSFCDQLLPTDRPHFSDETGLLKRYKADAKLPSESWKWEGEWQIETTFENQMLTPDGWTYSVDFPASYKPEKSWNSMVRRRKLFRFRRFTCCNRWTRIDSIFEDHTKEPFVDVSVGGFGTSHSDLCLWSISVLGRVFFRQNVRINNPEGSHWEHIVTPKGLEACQLGVSAHGVPFIVTWTGSFLFRVGLTPHNLAGTDWIEIEGPAGGLFQVSVGETSLWALTRDKRCWSLKVSLQQIYSSSSSKAEWMEIPGRMRCISVSRTDHIVIAVNDEDGLIMVRHGIKNEHRHGQQWIAAFNEVPLDTMSTDSKMSEISDCLDSGITESSSASSSKQTSSPSQTLCSLDSSVSRSDTCGINLCWVDGSCLSEIKTNNDGDLEIGPWRETILTNLQSMNIEAKTYDFPNAVESSSSTWRNSISARMSGGKDSGNCAGELEISNNDTLVFHKGLSSSWICSVRDILSVLSNSEDRLSFSVRVRSSFIDGRAELISFSFTNEKDAENWRQTVSDISIKSQESCTIANLWLTTEVGEIHQCGQLQIADLPSEMDIVTIVPGDSLKYHHPLVGGFCPGSELKVDISIPFTSDKFSLNLKGRDCTIFHFNPRFQASQVVRNSYEKGEWGEEERDGVFPFQKGETYSLLFQCSDSHLLTTVLFKKKKFIFSYKHRIMPRLISEFTAVGDVSVSSIRYDPGNPPDIERLEFVSTPIPGHFSNVSVGPNGMVWALSYDMSVWAYLLNSKHTMKLDGQNLLPVNDEKVMHVYENQRWNPISGFTANGLPTDRHSWTDETGRIRSEKHDIKLPSHQWSWITDWEVDFDLIEGVDQKGWQYALDFPASYHSSRRLNDFVRRRRWKRVCRYTTKGPWNQVPNIKLIDMCIWMNENCDWEVIGLSQSGDVVTRQGVSSDNPIGDNFVALPTEKPMKSISAWYGQRIWSVGNDGFAYIKYADHWQILDRPSSPLKIIRVGPQSVWALGTNRVLYRRTDIQPVFPEGREWCKVCGGVYDISVSGDGTLWGIIKNDSERSLAARMGITESQPNGLGWEIIAAGPWKTLCATGVLCRGSPHLN